MASYPVSIPSFVTPGSTLSSPAHSSQHVAVNNEVIAIATTLGENPQGGYATVRLRLEGIEASIGSTGHAQNTDLGTTNATFYINGITGPYLKGVTGNLQLRNSADSAYVNLTLLDINIQGNITNGVNTFSVAQVASAVADDHTHANKSTLDTYNQTNANLADAVSKKHTQNTDTGTTSETFQLNSADNGAKLKSDDVTGNILESRNSTDSGYSDFRAANFRGHLQADNADASRPTIKYDEALNYWVLANDGISFTPIAGGISLSGSAGYVQFAGAVNLDSDSDFTYDKVTDTLNTKHQHLTGDLRADGTVRLAGYATNGFLKTSAGNGTVIVDNSGFISDTVMTTPGDIIYGGVAGVATRLGIGGANTVLHGGVSVPGYSAVVEADITLSAVATNNANTTRHGFLPTLSNLTTQFLRGDGAWAAPAATTVPNAYSLTNFTGTSIAVTHNFGTYPLVQCTNNSGVVEIPYSVTHNSLNQVTIVFNSSGTYNILLTVGAPQLHELTISGINYATTVNDYFVEETGSGTTVTLHNPATQPRQVLVITNASSGSITLSGNINGVAGTETLYSQESLSVYSNGTTWRSF